MSHRLREHLRVLLAIAIVAPCAACGSSAATLRPRATSPYNDSTRANGFADTRAGDLRGGDDMPGKGRGSEAHERMRK
jgi:hypothetical protein